MTTSTTAHTPGQWTTYTDQLNSNVRVLAGTKVVANLARGLGLWAPDTDANARLIAAAPKMHGTLESIAEAADSLRLLTVEGSKAWQLAGTIATAARNAIANATGGDA